MFRLFWVWLLFAALSVIVPPLFHKTVPDISGQKETENQAEPSDKGITEPTDHGVQGTDIDRTQERILSIDDNREALLWRLRLIEAAREKIVLVTFDFGDDSSGQDVMAALLHAANRGVAVRILVDGMNGQLKLWGSDHFQELAEHENVEAKLYNPVSLLKPWKANYRMHDKYLIADDFAYILGGRNTNDLFLGEYVEKYNEDRDILVYESVSGQGNSYGQLQKYFEEIWMQDCCKDYRRIPLINRGKREKEEADLEQHYVSLRECYPEVWEKTDWEKETEPVRSMELYTGSVKPENKAPVLWKKMLGDMEEGKDILIQTPYMICSKEMYRDLAGLVENNSKVQILLNAVESGTNPFGCTDYLNQKKKIQKTGVDTYEYLGEQAMHTKTILIDEDISIVGSCNADMRSIYLDTEMMLVIDSPGLNAELRRQADKLMKQSRHILPDGTVQDGENYHPVTQSAEKAAVYAVLRVVTLPLRHLL